MRRRELLAGTVAAALSLAGCVYADPPDYCDPDAPPPVGFRLANRDDRGHAVEITVVRDFLVHVETAFEERYELAAAESVEVADVVDVAGRHVLTARRDDGEVGRLYWRVSPDGCSPALVSVSAGGVSVSQPSGVQRGPPTGTEGGGRG